MPRITCFEDCLPARPPVAPGARRSRWTSRPAERISSISRLSDDDQHQILDEIERIANAEFGGNVERPFVTVIYTSQRKPDVSLPPNRRIDS